MKKLIDVVNECLEMIEDGRDISVSTKIDSLFEGTFGEAGEGPESITYTDTIALVWFCEIFGENYGSDESISDYIGNESSWIKQITKLFDDYGLDVMTFADRRPAVEFSFELNKHWGGKCSIEDLERQFPDIIPRLARQVTSDVRISSDPKVKAYLDEKGCSDEKIADIGYPMLQKMFKSVSKGYYALLSQIQDTVSFDNEFKRSSDPIKA
jgi:hypothetical protein